MPPPPPPPTPAARPLALWTAIAVAALVLPAVLPPALRPIAAFQRGAPLSPGRSGAVGRPHAPARRGTPLFRAAPASMPHVTAPPPPLPASAAKERSPPPTSTGPELKQSAPPWPRLAGVGLVALGLGLLCRALKARAAPAALPRSLPVCLRMASVGVPPDTEAGPSGTAGEGPGPGPGHSRRRALSTLGLVLAAPAAAGGVRAEEAGEAAARAWFNRNGAASVVAAQTPAQYVQTLRQLLPEAMRGLRAMADDAGVCARRVSCVSFQRRRWALSRADLLVSRRCADGRVYRRPARPPGQRGGGCPWRLAEWDRSCGGHWHAAGGQQRMRPGRGSGGLLVGW